MKSAPNGYTPTVPSLHRDRETKRHERTKLRFYTERNSLEVVLIEDCLTTFSPALGAGEPQRLKPNSKQSTYRSGKPLRHPKTTATSTFSASCKAACVAGSDGMAEQAAEKVAVRRPAPKGASDFEELTVSLKRYPDTNLSFSAACKVVTFLESARSKIFPHPAKSARAAHPYFTPIRPAWRPIPSRIANASCSALRPSSNETTGHDRSRTECRKALISASSGSSAVIGGFAIWICGLTVGVLVIAAGPPTDNTSTSCLP